MRMALQNAPILGDCAPNQAWEVVVARSISRTAVGETAGHRVARTGPFFPERGPGYLRLDRTESRKLCALCYTGALPALYTGWRSGPDWLVFRTERPRFRGVAQERRPALFTTFTAELELARPHWINHLENVLVRFVAAGSRRDGRKTPRKARSTCPMPEVVPRLLKSGTKDSMGVAGLRSTIVRRTSGRPGDRTKELAREKACRLVEWDSAWAGWPGGSREPRVASRRETREPRSSSTECC